MCVYVISKTLLSLPHRAQRNDRGHRYGKDWGSSEALLAACCGTSFKEVEEALAPASWWGDVRSVQGGNHGKLAGVDSELGSVGGVCSWLVMRDDAPSHNKDGK